MEARRALAGAVLAAGAILAGGSSSGAATAPNPNIVIGQLNLWYYGTGPNGGFEAYDGSGKPTSRLHPLLGEYHSSDPRVVKAQINWAANYGVDVLSIEWLAPRGEPGSIEDNLDDAFLKAPNLCRVRWLIFDDFNLHLTWQKIDYSSGVDFDDPQIHALFVSDMVHFAQKYFKQPQYFKIDGRPVVYVWATWNFLGDVASAVQEARGKLKAMGYDVYLVGDEVAADRFNAAHAALWDATTSFTPFLMPGAPPMHDLPTATSFVDGAYAKWEQEIAGSGKPLQPGFTPQYDDVLFRTANAIPGPQSVQARSQAEVEALARASLAHAQPVGAKKQRIVWLNTFNNWAETTTVEPTASTGQKYPAGDYGYDMLKAVRDVFGAQTYGTGVRACKKR
jgi:Glycosyltransferase WbsX